MKPQDLLRDCHLMREFLMKKTLSPDDIFCLDQFCLDARNVALDFMHFKGLILAKQELEENIRGKANL